MQAMATRVLRGVQADPTLLQRALAGDDGALASLNAVAQGKAEPGLAIETRSDEERALVAQLISEGKTGAEIQTALDYLRANGKGATAEERRNTPGVVTMSTPLARVEGPWLAPGLIPKDGAPIPAQVAARLVGQRFSSFGQLRAAIWKAIADIPELAREFSVLNLRSMRDGNAPFPLRSEQVTIGSTGALSRRPYELHHDPAIGQDGPVYDLSTIRIVTPKQHDLLEKARKTR